MRLTGKVAIVTGGAQGIGRRTALTFAREGAGVMIGDVKDGGGLSTAKEIIDAGGKAAFVECDVTNLDHVRAMVDATVRQFGRIDILVNNAAMWRGGNVVDMPVEDWELGRKSILDAAYYCCRCAIPPMIESGGGSIISISSVHGLMAARHSAAYEAAKGGLIVLMKQVACDFGPQGVRANCICPGLIVTEKSEARFAENPDRRRLSAEVYPIRRYGRPDDIANAALYLASDESSFVSGLALVVDGGMTSQLQEDLVFRMTKFTKETGIAPE